MNKNPFDNESQYIDPTAHIRSEDERRNEYLKKHWSKIGKKVLAGIVILGVATAGFAAYESVVATSDNQNKTNPDEAFGTIDSQISSIELEAGAKLRQDPTIPWVNDENQNDMLTLEKDTKIEVDGAHIKNGNANGVWFGISEDDLAASGLDISRFKSDKDGVVWVNTQKADAFDKDGNQISDTDTENFSILNGPTKPTSEDNWDSES